MKDTDRLRDAFVRLAAVPPQPPLTRDEWVKKFQRIELKGLVVNTPDVNVDLLDARIAVVRIGSFWFRDEECHVYAMEQALSIMVQNRDHVPGAAFAVVTPIWAFYRKGGTANIVANPEALAVANRNFMRFFDEAYRRYKANG